MRKVVLGMSMSIDGFMEGPDRGLEWQLVDEELHQFFNDRLRGMGAFVNGRVTHELMAAFWPTADQQPGAAPQMVEFAGIWREMPKIVYSRTLTTTEWHTTVIREFDPEEVRALKAEPGGDLALGGAEVAGLFIEHGLVDEYLIYVHPVLLGEGNPLFPSSKTRHRLDLVETRTFGSGVVLLHYRAPEH